jgi:RNA polymerase sigma factor (sigma-70 family)
VAEAVRDGYEELLGTARRSLQPARREGWIEPEDLVHLAILMALSRDARCADPSRMVPFLKGVIVRLAMNFDRHRREVPLQEGHDLAAPKSNSWDPFVALADLEGDVQVRELLRAALSSREYEVFEMKEVEGKSIDEVARGTKLTQQSVKSYLRGARRKLRERLAGGG